jgi:hypothetical protein
LDFALAVQELGKGLVEAALKFSNLLLHSAEAPFDIALYLMAQAFFQFATDHSLFPPLLGSLE